LADGGWIKLYRKMRQSFVWTDANQLKLWLLLLMKASHEPRRFLFNGQQLDLSSGQMVTGRDALASEFNYGVKPVQRVSGRQLWRWIKLFESEQMLSIKSTTKYSVISISNWGEYQSDDQHLSIERPSTVHQVSTYKNDKNLKNEKKSSTTTGNNSAVNSFQNNIGFLAPITLEKMNDRISDFEQLGASNDEANKIIIKAIEIAVSRNKRSFGYVEGILKPWLDKNLNSVAVIEAEENQYQQSKLAHGAKGTARKPKQFQNFEQNDDQYDDLPF
jgi:DnaD/phage-associated family protein